MTKIIIDVGSLMATDTQPTKKVPGGPVPATTLKGEMATNAVPSLQTSKSEGKWSGMAEDYRAKERRYSQLLRDYNREIDKRLNNGEWDSWPDTLRVHLRQQMEGALPPFGWDTGGMLLEVRKARDEVLEAWKALQIPKLQ